MTLGGLIEDSIEVAGMYQECASRVDALINFATGESQ